MIRHRFEAELYPLLFISTVYVILYQFTPIFTPSFTQPILYLNGPILNYLVYIESDLSLRLQTNKLILSFRLSRVRLYNAAIHHFSFPSSLFKSYRSRHTHTLMRHFTENFIIEGQDYSLYHSSGKNPVLAFHRQRFESFSMFGNT